MPEPRLRLKYKLPGPSKSEIIPVASDTGSWYYFDSWCNSSLVSEEQIKNAFSISLEV